MCSINMQTLLEGKTYPQAGAELYDILVQKMDEPKIVLDMTGVSILPSMSSSTCSALVGLGLPDELALGAAMGTPADFISSSAT